MKKIILVCVLSLCVSVSYASDQENIVLATNIRVFTMAIFNQKLDEQNILSKNYLKEKKLALSLNEQLSKLCVLKVWSQKEVFILGDACPIYHKKTNDEIFVRSKKLQKILKFKAIKYSSNYTMKDEYNSYYVYYETVGTSSRTASVTKLDGTVATFDVYYGSTHKKNTATYLAVHNGVKVKASGVENGIIEYLELRADRETSFYEGSNPTPTTLRAPYLVKLNHDKKLVSTVSYNDFQDSFNAFEYRSKETSTPSSLQTTSFSSLITGSIRSSFVVESMTLDEYEAQRGDLNKLAPEIP